MAHVDSRKSEKQIFSKKLPLHKYPFTVWAPHDSVWELVVIEAGGKTAWVPLILSDLES